MYLKQLTIKGFKSFANPVTLDFTQGVSCIIGPNGSGKSNILDAIQWCLGEQGARSMRASSMNDIIFFGSEAKSRLSRADVICLFDNSDKLLPIDFQEVEIRRVLFRDGTSQYYINREAVRLSDIQKLLSNVGLGRQMHVIVGQGKLDSILQSPPERRRAFIEEAAGILDFRYRKEKASRQLSGLTADMTRLNDIIAEIKKQAGPLKRQASIAQNAEEVEAKSRKIRMTLLVDDYKTASKEVQNLSASYEEKRKTEEALALQISEKRKEVLSFETSAANESSEVIEINSVWYSLISLAEKYRSFISLSTERQKLLQNSHFHPSTNEEIDLQKKIDESSKTLENLLVKKRSAETQIASLKSKIEALALTLDSKQTAENLISGPILPADSLKDWLDHAPEKSLAEYALLGRSFSNNRDSKSTNPEIISSNSQPQSLGGPVSILKTLASRFHIFPTLDAANLYLLKHSEDFAVLQSGEILVSANHFTQQASNAVNNLKAAHLKATQELKTISQTTSDLTLKIAAVNDEFSKAKTRLENLISVSNLEKERKLSALKAATKSAVENLEIIEKYSIQVDDFKKSVSMQVVSSDSNIGKLRKSIDEINEKISAAKEDAHSADLLKTQAGFNLEVYRKRAVDEFGVAITELKAIVASESITFPLPLDARSNLEKERESLALKLAKIGRVNPLALEEYTNLNQRYEFLSEQYEDLEKTSAGLKALIADFSAKINTEFDQAFQDTSLQFDEIFQKLFPGGKGKLVLTEEIDGIQGIDVIASPQGKKMISLTLMSGGERSLIALALLVAMFKARPSPFYILDEVEAALDDANLHRVLTLFETLRANSQLMIITHQKSTMQVANNLYGVAMHKDGISKVISHKLEEQKAS